MIWLTGNMGMLGSAVEDLLKQNNIKYISSDIEVDLTEIDAINKFIADQKIDFIVNTAAYTDVDAAENDPKAAEAVNVRAVENLLDAAKKKGSTLIHISTDYIFDGKKDGAYTEEDEPCPINKYGLSKYNGEQNILSSINEFYIVRTSWLFGPNGKNFVDTIVDRLKQDEELKVVNDQSGCPTYSIDLAGFIFYLISEQKRQYGIYNFANTGSTSWYGFAVAIQKICLEAGIISKESKIYPVSHIDYSRPAVRPANSALSTDKIKKVFDLRPKFWENALKEYILEKYK